MSFARVGRHSGVPGRDDDEPSATPSPSMSLSLVRAGVEVATWRLPVDQPIDLSAVERVARLQLAARRLGYSVQLHQPSRALCELLHLAGLADVVGVGDGLVVEVGGESEGREQVRVEEGVERGDPVT
jgi:hypothetical protein